MTGGAAPARTVDRLFVGGRWVVPSTGDTLDVVEAHTEQVLGRVPVAGPDDVERAVGAARTAFDDSPWSTSGLEERIDAVGRIAAGMGERAEELARTITSENGAPLGFSRLGQVGAPIDILHSMMAIARTPRRSDGRPPSTR